MLEENWIFSPVFDFEYKKFILLDYFKKINKQLSEFRIFPSINQLKWHSEHLRNLKTAISFLEESFPSHLKKIDIKNIKIEYEIEKYDDEVIGLLENLIQYSLPKFEHYLATVEELYKEIESKLSLTQIGLTPIYQLEGYLFINIEGSKKAGIYRYTYKPILPEEESADNHFYIDYLNEEKITISNSFENLKFSLIRKFPDMPNPSTWLIISKQQYPLKDSLLPVALKLLTQQICS